ncbi:MAG: hypothetical protein CSA95_05760 [Bacteroidetes bacterium]|nr:MAG: hypothetical protein CSA95_05760 [Bacteroidota bacterium]PIE87726.1 MAG: hypothetical protein CSA04_05545 [Bacteroidota bacterium]
MKKYLLSLLAIVLSVTVFCQERIARQEVLLEIGTATWCGYCPGAAMGAEDLIANGHDVAVIEYHTSDAYTNNAATARSDYYGISGIPDAYFDGIENVSGGSATQSMYPSYLPVYQQRIVVPAIASISWHGTHEGNTYTVTSTIVRTAPVSNDITFHLSLTESGIQENWQNQTELHWVERWMHNEGQGEDIALQNSSPQTVTCTFTINSSWNLEELELVAFVQDNTNKEVLQTIKVMLEELPPPPPVADFTADQTDFCENGTVTFTNNSANADSWYWEFPGGEPATSTEQHPTVVYNTLGIFDVSLTATNDGGDNTKTKQDYIKILTTPDAPGQPSGNTSVCSTNSMNNYSVDPVPHALSYEWILTPPEAGVIFGTGASANASWTGDVIGDVTLKVKAINFCGESEFSPELTITINQGLNLYNVIGGGERCENEDGIEIILDNSDEGIVYELFLNNTATGHTVNGTGEGISFGIFEEAGIYTVEATDASGACTASMNGEAEIVVHPIPSTFNVEGDGTYCEGSNGATITLSGSEDQIKYELYRDGEATENTLLGNGGALTFENIMEEGLYTIIGDNDFCYQEMNGTVEVIAMATPEIPAMPEGDQQVCVNLSPQSIYTTTGGADATSYQWTIDVEGPTIEGEGLSATVNWNMFYEEPYVHISVRGINDCGESTFSEALEVHVELCSGVEEDENPSFIVYPNPATNHLYVELDQHPQSEIVITDALGKVHFIKQIEAGSSKKEVIDLQSLHKGVYFIQVKNDQSNVLKKFMVE